MTHPVNCCQINVLFLAHQGAIKEISNVIKVNAQK